jgi:myo-inositol-1(or 4)-monophosphatase
MHALVNIAINAVRKASKIVIRSMDHLANEKIASQARYEFVAEVKELANKEIINSIKRTHPEHKFISRTTEPEEFTETDYVWVIEAIDGTVNYAHNVPHIGMSIALKHKNKIQHAVVYDPVRQELFTASRGEGAYLNEHRIRVSQHKTLEGALLGTGFPHRQPQHLKTYATTFADLLSQCDGIRRSGASSLDLSYVACARLEGFWEFSLKECNMAAGVLIVQEAGGLVSDFQGEENYFASGNIIAGNPKIFKAILQSIQARLTE